MYRVDRAFDERSNAVKDSEIFLSLTFLFLDSSTQLQVLNCLSIVAKQHLGCLRGLSHNFTHLLTSHVSISSRIAEVIGVFMSLDFLIDLSHLRWREFWNGVISGFT